jgi:hypothetical protein
MFEDERERRYRRGARRRQWISHFQVRQRIIYAWICLGEIADWCARSVTGTSVAAEEQARELAYQRLDQSARDAEFEAEGQSRILYIHPRMRRDGASRRWLTREALRGVDNIRLIAAYCWLPPGVARRWLATHGYPWPAHFDPIVPQISAESAVEPSRDGIAESAVNARSVKNQEPDRGGTRTNKAEAAEAACQQRLSKLTRRPANKDAAFEEMRAAVAPIGPLSRKAFERQWVHTVPVDWKRGGRRKIVPPEI